MTIDRYRGLKTEELLRIQAHLRDLDAAPSAKLPRIINPKERRLHLAIIAQELRICRALEQ